MAGEDTPRRGVRPIAVTRSRDVLAKGAPGTSARSFRGGLLGPKDLLFVNVVPEPASLALAALGLLAVFGWHRRQ